MVVLAAALVTAHSHAGLSHEELAAVHVRNINPPLPMDRGRGILGCFLPNEHHCVGMQRAPIVPEGMQPAPLVPVAFQRVKLGLLKPTGWLARQLLLQANGMSGWYQALYYPAVNQSTWVGGDVKYMDLDYMVTYWLNGNVPLGLLLKAAGLRPQHDLGALTEGYLEFIIKAQDAATGQLGPDSCGGPFSKMNAIRSLLAAAEAADVTPERHAELGHVMLRGLRELYDCTLQGRTSGGIRAQVALNPRPASALALVPPPILAMLRHAALTPRDSVPTQAGPLTWKPSSNMLTPSRQPPPTTPGCTTCRSRGAAPALIGSATTLTRPSPSAPSLLPPFLTPHTMAVKGATIMV